MRHEEEARYRARTSAPDSAVSSGGVASCLLALPLFVLACVAPATTVAQTAGTEAPTSVPADTPRPSQPSGFFDAFGNWVQQGAANVGAGVGAVVGAVGGQAGQAAKGAADAARNAAKLPVSGVIGGRERCILAPNGAPDCRAAAETLCRTKGYLAGSSVDFETIEKCPPPYRTSGRDTPDGICTSEHFVTKALCQ